MTKIKLQADRQEMEDDRMESVRAQSFQWLRTQLHALDQLLDFTPLTQHFELDMDAVLLEKADDAPQPELTLSEDLSKDQDDIPVSDPLFAIVGAVPRFDLIPATLVNIYKTALQGRIHRNVYCHSDDNKSRDPTCSEALQLLPGLDEALKTSLRDKFDAIISTVPPFRFLDLPAELRLGVYPHLLPRLPYLAILDSAPPKKNCLPRYDLAPFQVCRQIHDELTKYFYRNQLLVLTIYDMSGGIHYVEDARRRDYVLVNSMRPDTRSYFRTMEIGLHTGCDPYVSTMYRHFKDYKDYSNKTNWEQEFVSTLEAFSNLEAVLISFELEFHYLNGQPRFREFLSEAVEWLFSNIPRRYRLQWDFRDTSDPELLEWYVPRSPTTMDDVKDLVTRKTAERGEEVVEGESLSRGPPYVVQGYGLPTS